MQTTHVWKFVPVLRFTTAYLSTITLIFFQRSQSKKLRGDGKIGSCKIRHRTNFVDCQTYVVCKIALYVRHAILVKHRDASVTTGHFATHVMECKFHVKTSKSVVLGMDQNQRVRKVVKTWRIKQHVPRSIGQPSVCLSDKGTGYLERITRTCGFRVDKVEGGLSL